MLNDIQITSDYMWNFFYLFSINISNILNRKEVKEIPPYFKNQSVPIVSYSYTNSRIPRGFCMLESKSLKVSCNVLGLEAFLTFGC
jgi:hypothetical protein